MPPPGLLEALSGRFMRLATAYNTVVQYKVLLKESEEGFAVWCPALPGCASQSDTEQGALENIRIAIQEYLRVSDEPRKDEDVRVAFVTVKEVA